jgi:ribosomal protein S27E
MAIEVVNRGHLPENDVFNVQCHTCKSDIRFLRSDGKLTFDQRDGDFLTIACPVCGNSVTADVKLGKSMPARPSR